MRKSLVGVVVLLVVAALTACSPSSVTPTFTDGYIKAVPDLAAGNATGVFGVITNPESSDVQLIGAKNTTAGLTDAPLEIHEVVMKDGAMVMQEVNGGINIPAKGGSVTMKPGGYHVMYWNLKQPIAVGSTVTLTLEFSNGTKVPVSVVARDLANAQEKYNPGAEASHSPMPSMSMKH